MRKWISVLLTVCFVFTGAAALAEEDEIGVYTDVAPEAMAFVSTWVAENGDWRIEVFDEDGGIKLMVVHALGDSKQDAWEYSATLNDTKLITTPTGLHYKEDIPTKNWDVTYYEDGEAEFALNEAGQLVWDDLKDHAGDGLKFDKIGNFFGSRWVKGDTEVYFYAWHDGEYDISLTQHKENGEVKIIGLLKGPYDPATDSVSALGSMEPDTNLDITFSYDKNYNMVWTENGESTTLEYSTYTD